MGKRSKFKRRAMDSYDTPAAAIPPLLPFLNVKEFAEPCSGNGYLVRHLEANGLTCTHASDIRNGDDALFYEDFPAPVIITNPPWTRKLLHPLITHFRMIKPTWLLFDSDWAYTQQAAPYLPYCSHIIGVGRLKWMPNTPYTGKDNASWYRFMDKPTLTVFYGRDHDRPVATG